jgi:hypothetical protein
MNLYCEANNLAFGRQFLAVTAADAHAEVNVLAT